MTTINITETRIKRGTPESASRCPIAMAINARLNKKYEAYVACGGVGIFAKEKNGSSSVEIQLPSEAQTFERNFDEKVEVAPFKFKLDIPAHLLK